MAPLLNNIGLNLQKVAHAKLQVKHADGETGEVTCSIYLKSQLWIFGLLLVIAASVLDFVALGFAPQTIIAPLGALNLMLNIVVIPLMQGVFPTWKDACGMMVAFAGAVICVIFASHSDDQFHELSDVFAVYGTPNFWIYAIVCTVWGLIGYYFIIKYDRIRTEVGASNEAYMKHQKCHRFLLASNAGMVGAQSVLFAKSTATLFMIMVRPDKGGYDGEMFRHFQTYLIVGMMFVTIVLQLKWLNDGLQRFSSMYTVPVFQAFWIIVSVAGGMICYSEMANLSLTNKLMFVAGIGCVMAGVYVLSQRPVDDKEENLKIAGKDRADRQMYRAVIEEASIESMSPAPARMTREDARRICDRNFEVLSPPRDGASPPAEAYGI